MDAQHVTFCNNFSLKDFMELLQREPEHIKLCEHVSRMSHLKIERQRIILLVIKKQTYEI